MNWRFGWKVVTENLSMMWSPCWFASLFDISFKMAEIIKSLLTVSELRVPTITVTYFLVHFSGVEKSEVSNFAVFSFRLLSWNSSI